MKKPITLLCLCLLCGIMFLIAGIFLTSRSAEFKENGISTQAEIVSIEREYDSKGKEQIDVYVKYTVEDTTYTRRLDYYSDALREGDIITILYLPNNPTKITYSKFNTVPQILFFTGAAVCFVASLICLYGIIFKKSKYKNLKGNKVVATVKQFDYPKNLYIFGKCLAHLVCVDDIGNSYEARFLYDKQQNLEIGSQVDVYVSEKNPKKYTIKLN